MTQRLAKTSTLKAQLRVDIFGFIARDPNPYG